MGKKVLITGGTGLIGKRLTELLLQKGYVVAYLSRHKKAIDRVRVFEWDIEKNQLDNGALENTDFLIHLAGAGIADGRWTEERKKEILDSRTKTADFLARHLKQNNIRPAAFISSSGANYYGGNTGATPQKESSPAGNDFLGQVCVAWEKSADQFAAMGIRTVKLRTGVVLSKDGGALEIMAKPANFGFGAALGPGDQWISWIHIEDLCNMYIAAMENESWEGAYNAVAPTPVTNETLTRQISKSLHKPQWAPNVPAFALKLVFGEMATTVLGSSYVENERVEKETDFTYQYPSIDLALQKELS